MEGEEGDRSALKPEGKGKWGEKLENVRGKGTEEDGREQVKGKGEGERGEY